MAALGWLCVSQRVPPQRTRVAPTSGPGGPARLLTGRNDARFTGLAAVPTP